MAEKKFTREEIKSAIYEVFSNYEELGQALGGKTKENVSDLISRQSPKFMNKLKRLGITVKKLDQSIHKEEINNSHHVFTGGTYYNPVFNVDEMDEKELKNKINELVQVIKLQEKLIKAYEAQLNK